jgi:hypothetical protein
VILEVGWAEKVRRRKKKKRNTKGKPTVYIIIKNFAVVLECVNNNWSRGLFPAAANRKMRHNWHDKSFDHMGASWGGKCRQNQENSCFRVGLRPITPTVI